MSYKTWGKYQAQTVRQDKDFKLRAIIRQHDNEILVNKCEIDSLVIALLEMRK